MAASILANAPRRFGRRPRGALAFRCFSREWRNRQTRTVQVRVPERAWGFNSPLAHITTTAPGSGPGPSSVMPGRRSVAEAWPVEVRRDQAAQGRQVVAALLDHHRGQAQPTEDRPRLAVAVAGDQQRALRVVGGRVHAEGHHQRGAVRGGHPVGEPADRVQPAVVGRCPGRAGRCGWRPRRRRRRPRRRTPPRAGTSRRRGRRGRSRRARRRGRRRWPPCRCRGGRRRRPRRPGGHLRGAAPPPRPRRCSGSRTRRSRRA